MIRSAVRKRSRRPRAERSTPEADEARPKSRLAGQDGSVTSLAGKKTRADRGSTWKGTAYRLAANNVNAFNRNRVFTRHSDPLFSFWVELFTCNILYLRRLGGFLRCLIGGADSFRDCCSFGKQPSPTPRRTRNLRLFGVVFRH